MCGAFIAFLCEESERESEVVIVCVHAKRCNSSYVNAPLALITTTNKPTNG